jgi:tripartite-type tricarboxylate transporter receptor subunit TctC
MRRRNTLTVCSMSMRRRALILAAAAGGAVLPMAVPAQANYPDRPLKIVVPFPPGALTDNLGRAVAERYRLAFGQPVVVENRPGAGTLLAAAQVAKAPADGYTMMIATTTTMGIAPALYANPPLKITDLTGVGMIGNVSLFLVLRPDFPALSLNELIGQLRRNPGKYNYASPGNGTVHHLVMEMLKVREKVFATHIPYNGSVQALTDVISGRIDFMFIDAAIVMPQLRADKLRALVVTGSQRSSLAPQVPAMTEIYPELDLQAWQSVAVPVATAPELIARLNAELNRALASADFLAQLAAVGVQANPMSSAQLNALIAREAPRWAELVKRSGARVD